MSIPRCVDCNNYLNCLSGGIKSSDCVIATYFTNFNEARASKEFKGLSYNIIDIFCNNVQIFFKRDRYGVYTHIAVTICKMIDLGFLPKIKSTMDLYMELQEKIVCSVYAYESYVNTVKVKREE